MRVVALISGGKDSCFNMLQCVASGHEIVALANLQPAQSDEIDSYMYQTVGHDGISMMADAMDLPLYRRLIKGNALVQEKDYSPTEGDEVEDLYDLLVQIQAEISFDAISVGAILSDYQRIRVENVCSRINCVSLAYLWRRNQSELLQEMIDCKINAIIIKTASLGLDPNIHLGKNIEQMQAHLNDSKDKYGINVCGEGGEYETFTLDCPLFKQTIILDKSEKVIHSNDAFAPVGYLKLEKLHLVKKTVNAISQKELLGDLPVRTPMDFLTDLVECKIADCCEGRIEICKNSNNEHGERKSRKSSIESSTTSLKENPESSIDNLINLNLTNDNESEAEDDKNIENFIHSKEVLPTPQSSILSIINSGGWCWIMGLQGFDSNPNPMHHVLESLKNVMETQQMSLQNIVGIVLYVNDMGRYADYNGDYIKFFSHNPPIRVCIESPLPQGTPIILEAIAFKQPRAEIEENSIRNCMHIQGISHWAPANIGPYSQAIWIGDIIYVAGQIGLVPGSMALVDGGARIECKLALRHVNRILKAACSKVELRDVVQGICYVTHPKYIESCRQEWEKRTNNSIVEYLVVPRLPRNARVEWQIWAHKHNANFEYEETGCFIGSGVKVRIIRRWNYENTVSAIVCRAIKVEETYQFTNEGLGEIIEYAMNKILSGAERARDVSLRVFYLIGAVDPSKLYESLEQKTSKYSMAFTVLPVSFQMKQSIISFCGVRHI